MGTQTSYFKHLTSRSTSALVSDILHPTSDLSHQSSFSPPLVLLWYSFGDLRTDPPDKIASDKKEKE